MRPEEVKPDSREQTTSADRTRLMELMEERGSRGEARLCGAFQPPSTGLPFPPEPLPAQFALSPLLFQENVDRQYFYFIRSRFFCETLRDRQTDTMRIVSENRSEPSSSRPCAGAPFGALLDKVTIGLNILLPVTSGDDWTAVRDRLVAMDLFPALSNARPPASEKVKVRFAVEGIGEEVGGQLTVSANGSEAVTFGSGSRLILNPLKALRALGASADQGPCLDGGDNTVGACNGNFHALLERQLEIIAENMDAFFSALREACGGQALAGRMWVRAAEVCRDIAVGDAIDLVAGLTDTAVHGCGRSSAHRVRAKGALSHFGTYHTLAWDEDRQTDPLKGKIYPKRPELVRTEIVFGQRSTVRRFLAGDDPVDAPLIGRDGADLLRPLVDAALPFLDVLLDHLQPGQAPVEDDITFLAGLVPLLRLARPERGKGGRPCSEATRTASHHAVRSLLRAGHYRATGFGKESPLRRALDEMADDPAGIVLRGGGRDTTYTVRPEFEPARRALSVSGRRSTPPTP